LPKPVVPVFPPFIPPKALACASFLVVQDGS
jgi:hypothetical protein